MYSVLNTHANQVFLSPILGNQSIFTHSNYCCCTIISNVDFPLPFITKSLENILDGGPDYIGKLGPQHPNESDSVTLDHYIFPCLVYHGSVLLRFHLILWRPSMKSDRYSYVPGNHKVLDNFVLQSFSTFVLLMIHQLFDSCVGWSPIIRTCNE